MIVWVATIPSGTPVLVLSWTITYLGVVMRWNYRLIPTVATLIATFHCWGCQLRYICDLGTTRIMDPETKITINDKNDFESRQ